MIKPTYEGELQLAGWSETHNGGCKVTFWLPDSEALDPFRGLTIRKGNQAGQIFMAALVEVDDSGNPKNQKIGDLPEEKEENSLTKGVESTPGGLSLARQLHASGYFNNQRLWAFMQEKGIYTETEHHEFVKLLPCCQISSHAVAIACSGDVVGHHVRTAANSGTGMKPSDFWEIPLCHAHHADTHNSAERLVREQQQVYVVAIMADRIKMAMKRHLGLDSLTGLTEEIYNRWCNEIGL